MSKDAPLPTVGMAGQDQVYGIGDERKILRMVREQDMIASLTGESGKPPCLWFMIPGMNRAADAANALLAWITVGPSPVINRMDVNHLSERKMMKHPYMGYYRASEIAAYRKVHGRLDNIKALYGLQHFSESDIQRLAPYLEFR